MTKANARHDIDMLGSKIDLMADSLRRLTDTERLVEKIKRDIIGPGWTTPAEFFLITELVTSITTAADEVARMQQTLLNGSELITSGH